MADLGVLRKTDMVDIVESRMAKIYESIKTEVSQIVKATFDDALEESYFDSNDGFKMAVFIVIENALVQGLRVGCGRVLDETQLAWLIQANPIVEIFVKSVRSSTTVIVPTVEIIWSLVDKSFDVQRFKHLDGTSSPIIHKEPPNECSSTNSRNSSK